MDIFDIQISRRLEVFFSESEYFKVIRPPKAKHKVGSGLTLKYLVQFTPAHKQVSTCSIAINFMH